jgi:hypothetical protein
MAVGSSLAVGFGGNAVRIVAEVETGSAVGVTAGNPGPHEVKMKRDKTMLRPIFFIF